MSPSTPPFLDQQPSVQPFVTSLLEMEMESRGSVNIMKMQSQHKTTGQSLWRELLSARSGLQPHPLAEQAQACGRLTQADGPEGPIAPIVVD